MNSAGDTIPRSGCRHRSNASKPLISLSCNDTIGFHAPVHLRFEEPVGAVTLSLCTIHGHIGALQKLIWIAAVIGRNCDANTCAHDRLLAADLEWLAERLYDVGRERRRRLRLLATGLQDRKLVAAKAAH
jgi:hypothetical protein